MISAALMLALPLKAEIHFTFDKNIHADKGGLHQRQEIAGIDRIGVQGKPLQAAAKLAENGGLVTGIIGKALKVGVSPDGKKRFVYRYNPQIDMNTDQGTVMFWVKPQNWLGKDKKFHLLFTAGSSVKPGYTMFIYKYQSRPDLFFFFNGTYAFANVKDWKADEWHHVAAVWKADELYLYIDGRLKKGVKTKKRAKDKFQYFTFGSMRNWPGEVGETLIDEAKILDKPLNESAVTKEYSRVASFIKNVQSPIEIAAAPVTPKLDGKLSTNEYSFAGCGFFNIFNGKYAVTQSRWGVAYDKNNLYFAMVTPVGKNVSAKFTKRDENIWEDDSIEIHIQTTSETKYQFVFNSSTGIFDKKDNNTNWNAANVKTCSKIEKNLWTFECAIPLSNFGKIDKPFFINLCRSIATPREFTSAAPANFAYADYRNFIKIIPVADAPRIDMQSLGDLNAKKLNFKASIRNDLKKQTACSFYLNTDNQFLPYQKKDTVQIPANKSKVYTAKKDNLHANVTLGVNISDSTGRKLYFAKFPYHDINPASVHNLFVRIPTKTMYVAIKNYTPALDKFIQVRFIDQNKKTVMTAKQKITPNSYSEVPFSITKVKDGMYTVHTDILDKANKVLYTNYFNVKKTPDKPWWSNPTAGLKTNVPVPWTTPAASKDEFKCMYRTYAFKSGSLLSTLNIKGDEFLSAPAVLKINGKKAAFKTTLEKGKKVPAVNDYTHTANIDGVSVNVAMQAEYDGLLRYTLKIKPASAPVKLSSMTFEIPVSAKYGTCFDDCTSHFIKNDLLKDKGKSISKNMVFSPFFRIGNEKTGLLGGISSLRGWYIKDKTKSLVIDNQKDTVTVKFNFIATPLELKKERTIKFYLQATPIKPKVNMSKSKKASLWTGYWTHVYDYKVNGYFDDKEIQKLEKKLRPGAEYHWYFTSAGVSPFSPKWYYWGLNWHNDPPTFGTVGADSDHSKRVKRERNGWTYGCLSSKSFLDFKIRTVTDAIMNKKYNVNNLYFDISWPKICWNKEHGCLWFDEFGDRMPTNDWEQNREFHERVYRVLKEKNPDNVITQHLLSGWTPADAFCDIIVGGEVYEREVADKEGYYDCFTPRFMRMQFTPRGADRDYWMIPQFLRSIILYKPAQLRTWKADSPKNRKAIMHMLGALYVHDVNCWPIFGTEKYVNQGRKYRNQLTDTDYIFHPYWEKGGPVVSVSPKRDDLMVSVYEKDNKYLIAVLNNADKKQTAVIDLKGLNNRKYTEAFSEKDYVVKNNKITLELAPRNFQLFFFDIPGKK